MSSQKLDAVLRDIVRSQDAEYAGNGGYFKVLDSLKRVRQNLDTSIARVEQANAAWSDQGSFGKRQAN
jgi:hypothetical protein